MSCDWVPCPSSICTFVSAQTRKRTHHLSRDILCYCGCISYKKNLDKLSHSSTSPHPPLSTEACLFKFSLEEVVVHFSSDFTLPASTALKILLRAIDKMWHINFWTVFYFVGSSERDGPFWNKRTLNVFFEYVRQGLLGTLIDLKGWASVLHY